MPLYKWSDFSCGRTNGLTDRGIPWGPRGPKKEKRTKIYVFFSSNKENIISDYSIGCKVLSEAR